MQSVTAWHMYKESEPIHTSPVAAQQCRQAGGSDAANLRCVTVMFICDPLNRLPS